MNVCAYEPCAAVHNRKSKYCCEDCRRLQKNLYRNERRKRLRATDEEYAERERKRDREWYAANRESCLERRRQRKHNNPELAERRRAEDRARSEERRKDPEYVRKQKEYHRNRYQNDPAFREAAIRRSRRSKERIVAAKKFMQIQAAIKEIGAGNE